MTFLEGEMRREYPGLTMIMRVQVFSSYRKRSIQRHFYLCNELPTVFQKETKMLGIKKQSIFEGSTVFLQFLSNSQSTRLTILIPSSLPNPNLSNVSIVFGQLSLIALNGRDSLL